MNRALTTTMVFLLSWVTTLAQDGIPHMGDPWLLSEGAMAVPSLQGRGFKRASLTIPSLQAWGGNTALSYKALRDIAVRNLIQEEHIQDISNSTDEQFSAGVGLQLQLLSLGLNLGGKDGGVGLSLGVEHRERTLFNMNIDRELVTLLYEGNKQYAGRELLLDPLDIRSVSYRELGVNGAVDIPLGGSENRPMKLRPGIGIYKVFALQGIDMEQASMSMFTRADGRAVDLRSNYAMNTAIPESGGNLFNGIGGGVAIDASLALALGDDMQFFAGVDDIGSVKFSEGVKNYSATGAYTFRGVQFTFIDQELESTVTLDSLIEMGDPDITEEAWSMQLPTRLLAGGTYGSHLTEYEAFPLFRHMWGLYIAHEFKSVGSYYAPTIISASYTYTAAERASFGVLLASNGDRIPRLGLNLTVRAGPVRLGIGSTNLSPLLVTGSGAAAQGQFALQFAW